MIIFPAIDMIGGKAVRLFQGDYAQKQIFGDDPAQFANRFKKAGATAIHLVDLDGAKEGTLNNFDAVRAILAEGGLFTELGGGIRNQEAVARCFEAGIDRVILGTSALKDPAFTRAVVQQYGDKIAVGVDARDGKVATEGWLQTSSVDSLSFCREMAAIGVQYIIYTDISKDGAGAGTNLEIYEALSAIPGLNITASGGISSLEEISILTEMGLYAAILGKAIYTGALTLEEAIATAREHT